MARPKMSDDEKWINSEMKKVEPQLACLDNARRDMATKELRDYFWTWRKCETLRQDIDDEGLLIDGQENPKLSVFHKMTGRKSTQFSQIMRWLPKKDATEEDALSAFLKSN